MSQPSSPNKCKGTLRLSVLLLSGCATGMAFGWAVEAGQVMLGRNFHTVLPARVYRCAQLSGKVLEETVREYEIKTVVNLRGCSPPLNWYLEEAKATHRAEVTQEDVGFSAGRFPSIYEVRRFVRVLDRAQYPLLLHCRQGADRTGLASALVLLLQTDTDLDTARKQLGMRYGHFPVHRAAFLDRFLDLYARWLVRINAEHSSTNLRRWIANDAFPGECRYTFEVLTGPTAVKVGEPFAMHLRYRNIGLMAWHFRAGRSAGVHVGYLIVDMAHRGVMNGRSGLFNRDVASGESIDVVVAIPAVRNPGRYRVMLDLIDERHCSFFQVGTEPTERELEVHD